MAEIKGGFLNTELWSELPKEQWLEKEYRMAKDTGLPVIISLGYSAEQRALSALRKETTPLLPTAVVPGNQPNATGLDPFLSHNSAA